MKYLHHLITVSLSCAPANTQRDKRVIITSKRRSDVIITYLLRCVFLGVFLSHESKDISEDNFKRNFWDESAKLFGVFFLDTVLDLMDD